VFTHKDLCRIAAVQTAVHGAFLPLWFYLHYTVLLYSQLILLALLRTVATPEWK